MSFEWNAHRFSGGALVLDLVNTVIYRDDPERSVDRFSDRDEVARFAEAACGFRAAELGGTRLSAERNEPAVTRLLDLREAANGLFRTSVRANGADAGQLARFLQLGAVCLDALPAGTRPLRRDDRDGAARLPLDAAVFLSGLRLLEPERLARIKICPNCHWLYLDASRNRSRRWCDMAVCGNRQKARRHYDRIGREVRNAADKGN